MYKMIQHNISINYNVALADREIFGMSHYIYKSSSFKLSNHRLLRSKQVGLVKISCCMINGEGNSKI